MLRLTLILLTLALALGGCGERVDDAATPVGSAPVPVPPEQANLTLLVSNQSLVDRVVDIEVRVNGHVVVDGTFDVQGENDEAPQHNVFRYPLRLEPGAHELTATARDGAVGTSKTVLVDGPRWAAVDYWRSAGEDQPRLRVMLRDEPIKIE